MSVDAANTTPLQPEPQSFLIEGKRLTKERKFIKPPAKVRNS